MIIMTNIIIIIKTSWTLFNLREQSEVLQLLLLYLHQTGEVRSSL